MPKVTTQSVEPTGYKQLVGVASAHPNALQSADELVSRYIFYDKMLIADLDHAIKSHSPGQMFAKVSIHEMLESGKKLGVFEDASNLRYPEPKSLLTWNELLVKAVDGSLVRDDPLSASGYIQSLLGTLYQTEYNNLSARFDKARMDLGVEDLHDKDHEAFVKRILVAFGVQLEFPSTEDARSHAEGTEQLWRLEAAQFLAAQDHSVRKTVYVARTEGMIAEDASERAIVPKSSSIMDSSEYSVASILLDQIPVPDNMNLEELYEFKSDPKVKESIRSFRSLVAGITNDQLTENEARELFDDSRADLKESIRKAKREVVFNTVKISVICGAGVAQDLATGKFIEAADRVISASKDLVNLYPTDKAYAGHPLFFTNYLGRKR